MATNERAVWIEPQDLILRATTTYHAQEAQSAAAQERMAENTRRNHLSDLAHAIESVLHVRALDDAGNPFFEFHAIKIDWEDDTPVATVGGWRYKRYGYGELRPETVCGRCHHPLGWPEKVGSFLDLGEFFARGLGSRDGCNHCLPDEDEAPPEEAPVLYNPAHLDPEWQRQYGRPVAAPEVVPTFSGVEIGLYDFLLGVLRNDATVRRLIAGIAADATREFGLR